MKKVLICGGTGFFGKHIQNVLSKDYKLFAFGSKDYDLLDFRQAEKMFQDTHPDIVIHLAAKVGGILANKSYPAEFWYKNMILTSHVWELTKKYSANKMLYIMPGCCYPKDAPSPLTEEGIWEGFPDLHPAPGALAKKMGLVASYAYKQQYGLKSTVIIPANMFGEYDIFDEYHSHVIPALIMKMHKAKKAGDKEITLWGSGRAIRDFIYAGDVAKCIPYFIENDVNFPSSPHLENVVNLSTGHGTTIKELAETVVSVVGYEGKIIWDDTKPEGPLNKTFANNRMKSLGLSSATPLKEAIQRTYEWYLTK